MPDLDRDTAIALARRGKDAWNAWAAENPGARVDFSGATLEGISFAEFQFPGSANFARVTFSNEADFTGVTFSKEANFTGARFSAKAYLSRVTFCSSADFAEVEFYDRAFFTQSTVSDGADFGRAIFYAEADFPKVTFSARADFIEAKFSKSVNFAGGSFTLWVRFDKASFHDEVDFSGWKFNGPAYFRGAFFSRVPIFHGAFIHQGTEFGDIDKTFTDFQSDEAEHRYRTLKLAMGQYQARPEEAAFAALELKARRYRLKSEAREKKLGWQRFLSWADRCGYSLWDKFSDSGRSFFRPFALYLASLLGSAALYVTLPIRELQPPLYVLFLQGRDWWLCLRYAFLKQFPFAGAFRGGPNRVSDLEKEIFGAGLPPGWVDSLNSAQSIIAFALIFLMGLGIRHKFRLR